MCEQITLSKLKEKIAEMQSKGEAFHFYYKRSPTLDNLSRSYIITDDLNSCLQDEDRYGSLFFRVGTESNWTQHYQVLSDTVSEPI